MSATAVFNARLTELEELCQDMYVKTCTSILLKIVLHCIAIFHGIQNVMLL